MRTNRIYSAIILVLVAFHSGATLGHAATTGPAEVEQWNVFELALNGPADGNPFVEVDVRARFTQGSRTLEVRGFYDGGGLYKIRFMPDSPGKWQYSTTSNRPELDGKSGVFAVLQPGTNRHGPVRVHGTFHFAYADGTPFRPIGTTCYVWTHQGDELEEQTLKTLATSPFNKIRFCIFPKRYVWNNNEPIYYPFEGVPPNNWDFSRPNPAFFHHFERRLAQLRNLGIEADVILFHPYDRGHWGFDRMGATNDDRYIRYVVARLAAYSNVWWSLANEFDLIESKKMSDWDRLFQIVQVEDPYQHLRSIHQDRVYYDHNKPWVTHASVQNAVAVLDYGRAMIYRDVYHKPIVFDEVRYEGNIPSAFGNLSAEQLVLRFWTGTVAGTYVGHGETYMSPDEVLWWSKGGVLHGLSPSRIAFLKKILEESPADGINPIDGWQEIGVGGKRGEYYLVYFGTDSRTSWKFQLCPAELEDGMKFSVEVLDTWNMTILPIEGVFTVKRHDAFSFEDINGRCVSLPGRPYMALRILRRR